MNSRRRTRPLLALAAALLAGLGACSDGNTQPLADRVIIEDRNIQSITLSSPRGVIAVGEIVALSATEGTSGEDLREDLTWSSSDTNVATVDGQGQVTGIADGVVTIGAGIGEIAATLSLTVSSAGLISIEVTSDAVPIDVCTNGQLVANGTYADGRVEDETANVTWQSADTAAGQFDTTTAGQLNTRLAGTLNVTASIDGVTSPEFAVVISDALSSVTSVLADASIDAGAQTTLTVTGNYSGTLVDITTNASFASSDTGIATVDSSGTVEGVASGSATLTSSCNALTSEATVTVSSATTRTLIDLDLQGNEPFIVRIGETLQLTALAEYSDGTTENVTEQTSWTVAIGSANVFSVDNVAGMRGLVTPLLVGTGFVRADFEGETVTAQIDVLAP